MTVFDGGMDAIGSMRNGRRYFTLDEANRALVLVRRVVADITSDYANLSDLQETMEAAQESGRYDLAESARDKIIDTVNRVHDCSRELDSVGAELLDWMLGIVGFPCIAGGREVMLCWIPDDREVLYWCEAGEDYVERRGIETLPLEHHAPVRRR